MSVTDLVSIMKKREIEWLEHIASLNKFTSDSSRSVDNARKDDTEIVPRINSTLPLLRQSVATNSIQKHCIEGIINERASAASDASSYVD